MKRFFFVILVLSILSSVACSHKTGPYIDGVYKGKSQASYSDEPYVGYVIITIKNGWPNKAEFKIIDTAKNEVFNEGYKKYFEGNENYINQCRNDLMGIQTYPAKLVNCQSIEKVDAVSGATWSYNIFRDATLKALKSAKR